MSTRIVISGANGHVGRALSRKLWDTNAETYAVTRTPGPVQASRILTLPLDSERVQKVIRKADVVIHLAGTLFPKVSNCYYGANVTTTAAIVRAARNSNVKRIIFLSSLRADVSSVNEYLRTKALAEQLLYSTGIPTVIFRSSHIIGSPDDPGLIASALVSKDGEPVKLFGTGHQLVAPIHLQDVVSALMFAIEKGRGGVYELSGPDRMTMIDLAQMINNDAAVPIKLLPGRLTRFLSKVMPGIPAPFVDLMMKNSIGNPAKAMNEFGLETHSLTSVWGPNGKIPAVSRFAASRNEGVGLYA